MENRISESPPLDTKWPVDRTYYLKFNTVRNQVAMHLHFSTLLCLTYIMLKALGMHLLQCFIQSTFCCMERSVRKVSVLSLGTFYVFK